MKRVLLLFLVLLFPFSVYAKDTCDSNAINIESIKLESSTGYIKELRNADINNQKINLGLKMDVVGDSAEYKIVLKNSSDEDYFFGEEALNLDMDSFNYEVRFEDETNLIKGGEEKVVYLKVVYKEQIDSSNFNNGIYDGTQVMKLDMLTLENPYTGRFLGLLIFICLFIGFFVFYKDKKKTAYLLLIIGLIIPFTAKAICRHTLEVETNLVIDRRTAIFLPGVDVNVKMKHLAGDDTSSSANEYEFNNTSITSIQYSNVEPIDINKEEKNIVSIPESGYPIYMWYDNGTIYWWSEDNNPSLNVDASYMFNDLLNLSNISGVENFDTSSALSLKYLFYRSSITSVMNLQNWDTSKVEDLSWIFKNNLNLLSLDGLENWDTSNVNNLAYAFSYNMALTDMSAVKYWDVSKVTSMVQLFSSCVVLEEIDLSNWTTSDSLVSMFNMFGMWDLQGKGTDSKLKRIILSDKFNTRNVTSLANFITCNNKIEDYSFLQYIDTSSVTNMYQTLAATNLVSLEYIKDWNVSNVKYMHYMFAWDRSLQSVEAIKDWDVSNVTDMSYMFDSCTTLKNLVGLENWNVSNVDNMERMFAYSSLQSVEALANWNTKSLTNMSKMFMNNRSLLSTRGLENWDTSKVTDINNLFFFCDKMTYINLENWDVSSVTNMDYAFAACVKASTINISSWRTDSLTSMALMFTAIQYVRELDIHNFDTRNVTDFSGIFDACENIEVIYVGENWSIESNTGDTAHAFYSTSRLRNFSPSNPDYRNLSYAHAGEGGYLTLKTD